MQIDYDAIVLERIRSQRHFRDWRRAVHNMRRLVAGDRELLGLGRSQQEGQPPETEDRANLIGFGDDGGYGEELYNIVVVDAAEGLSNKLWTAIKTLVFESAYRLPKIDFEDLSSEEASINSAYLKTVLGSGPNGCQAVDAMRLCLLDYMISGYGWANITVDATGRPGVEYADALDVTWDLGRTLVTDIRWVSRKIRKPVWEWMEIYGAEPFDSLLSEGEHRGVDRMIACDFYYDKTGGDRGHHYAVCAHLDQQNRILEKGDNPFFVEVAGFKRPFLPLEPIYFMQLPSVRFAMGLTQNMLPHQISMWLVENNLTQTVRNGVPHYVIEKGAMDDKARRQFEDGSVASVVEINAGKNPPVSVPGLEIRQTDLEFYNQHNQELTSQSGANPYAGGSRVEGVNFASEVAAINASSSLTAGVISKDHAAHWQRVASKVLWAGAAFDRNPYEFQLDDVRLEFGEELPLQDFLQPIADVIVREESAAFQPRAQRIQEALVGIDQALKLSGFFPEMVRKATEDYLRALGEKNIAGYMQGPTPGAAVSPGGEAQSDIQ